MHYQVDGDPPPNQTPWLSVLVLTRNEAPHIERCIRSASRLTNIIFVVDSCSLDGTALIAETAGAMVQSRSFDNFSEKLNWSLENVPFPTPWVMRLDADEVLSDELIATLASRVARMTGEISGVYLRRQLWFMGQWIKHGGMYPTYSMRLWRTGLARCEVRDLDEHMLLTLGVSIFLPLDIIDKPLTNLTNWIDKHNRYSSLEAKTALGDGLSEDLVLRSRFLGNKMERTRWMKQNIFYRLPMFFRPWLYFFYRYLIRLGFLDGRRGFLFHFFHGLWYRILVDAKIYESSSSKMTLGSEID